MSLIDLKDDGMGVRPGERCDLLFSAQAVGTAVVGVSADLRVLRQAHFFFDLRDQGLFLEDATIREESELARLRVVHHAPTWCFFIFRFWGDCPIPLVPLPHFRMTSWMGEEVTVLFGLTKGRAVDQQIGIDQPEDTDAGLFLSILRICAWTAHPMPTSHFQNTRRVPQMANQLARPCNSAGLPS
jgi:hypothetical protein